MIALYAACAMLIVVGFAEIGIRAYSGKLHDGDDVHLYMYSVAGVFLLTSFFS